MRHLKYSLCWLPLLSESLGLTSLIGFQPLVQPMLVRCTCRMTELSYTSGCPPYFYELFLRNHWVTLHLLVSILKCSLWFLGLLIESLDHTTLLGAPPTVQLMFVSSTYRITGLHYTYGSATLSAAYVGYLYVENHRVTLQLLVRHLKQNLRWLPLTLRFTEFYLTWRCGQR